MDIYPIYINGNERGELRVYTEGLMTVFDARCDKAKGIVKLYIFGAEGKAYLGTMQPQGSGLRLVRRLSRAALRSFPDKPEYAADREIKMQEPERNSDILWRIGPKGCLAGCDGENKLIAIPADGKRLKYGRKLLRVIEGREYIVFPGKRKI
ncbi:MAG: hypothetical protein ACI3VK_06535 [Oscillospiraceae bacterium]